MGENALLLREVMGERPDWFISEHFERQMKIGKNIAWSFLQLPSFDEFVPTVVSDWLMGVESDVVFSLTYCAFGEQPFMFREYYV